MEVARYSGLYGDSYTNALVHDHIKNPEVTIVCGHVFKLAFIRNFLKINQKCPECHRAITWKQVKESIDLRISSQRTRCLSSGDLMVVKNDLMKLSENLIEYARNIGALREAIKCSDLPAIRSFFQNHYLLCSESQMEHLSNQLLPSLDQESWGRLRLVLLSEIKDIYSEQTLLISNMFDLILLLHDPLLIVQDERCIDFFNSLIENATMEGLQRFCFRYCKKHEEPQLKEFVETALMTLTPENRSKLETALNLFENKRECQVEREKNRLLSERINFVLKEMKALQEKNKSDEIKAKHVRYLYLGGIGLASVMSLLTACAYFYNDRQKSSEIAQLTTKFAVQVFERTKL